MSKIFYKFKAAKDYDQCTFDGPSLSVFDLKREIMVGKKLGKGLDFDLAIVDAHTQEEHTDDNYQIPRNSSVIVRRVPAAAGKGTAQRYLSGMAYLPRGVQMAQSAGLAGSQMAVGIGPSTIPGGGGGGAASSTAPLPNSQQIGMTSAIPGAQNPVETLIGETEEDKIKAMLQQSDEAWKKQSSQLAWSQQQRGLTKRPMGPRPPPATNGTANGATSASTPATTTTTMQHSQQSATYHAPTFSARPPPPNYICFRCGVKGHWLQFCPTHGDPTYDNIRVKKTTGIPKTFLKSVKGDGKGVGGVGADQVPAGQTVMVTPDGEMVVATLNDAIWQKNQGGGTIHLTDDLLYEAAREFTLEQQAQLQKQAESGEEAPIMLQLWIPDPMSCSICAGLAREAVRLNCCRSLFCDRCVRETIQSQAAILAEQQIQQNVCCPKCSQPTSLDNIVIDKPTRALVDQHLRKVGEEVKRRAAGLPAGAAPQVAAPQVPVEARDLNKSTEASAVPQQSSQSMPPSDTGNVPPPGLDGPHERPPPPFRPPPGSFRGRGMEFRGGFGHRGGFRGDFRGRGGFRPPPFRPPMPPMMPGQGTFGRPPPPMHGQPHFRPEFRPEMLQDRRDTYRRRSRSPPPDHDRADRYQQDSKRHRDDYNRRDEDHHRSRDRYDGKDDRSRHRDDYRDRERDRHDHHRRYNDTQEQDRHRRRDSSSSRQDDRDDRDRRSDHRHHSRQSSHRSSREDINERN